MGKLQKGQVCNGNPSIVSFLSGALNRQVTQDHSGETTGNREKAAGGAEIRWELVNIIKRQRRPQGLTRDLYTQELYWVGNHLCQTHNDTPHHIRQDWDITSARGR